jgi:hypothetical protein
MWRPSLRLGEADRTSRCERAVNAGLQRSDPPMRQVGVRRVDRSARANGVGGRPRLPIPGRQRELREPPAVRRVLVPALRSSGAVAPDQGCESVIAAARHQRGSAGTDAVRGSVCLISAATVIDGRLLLCPRTKRSGRPGTPNSPTEAGPRSGYPLKTKPTMCGRRRGYGLTHVSPSHP